MEKPLDPYVASRQKSIADLERKKAEFIAELESGGLSNILTRKRQEDLTAIRKEILELQGDIDAYLVRTGNK